MNTTTIQVLELSNEDPTTVLMESKPLEVEDAMYKMTKAIDQFEMNSVVRNKGEDLEETNKTRSELGKAVGDWNICRGEPHEIANVEAVKATVLFKGKSQLIFDVAVIYLFEQASTAQ